MWQVLGRNLEAAVTKAESLKKEMGDEFVSVEHLLLALADDSRVIGQLLRSAGLDAAKLEAATKEVRGSNRVTDQVGSPSFCYLFFLVFIFFSLLPVNEL